MKGQKQAVVEKVLASLPGFVVNHDIALVMLTKDQLEAIKLEVARDIEAGAIEYSKNQYDWNEVKAYSRSMVMNHLKKAKELNGGQTYGKTIVEVDKIRKNKALSGIDMTVLPEDVAEIVNNLV